MNTGMILFLLFQFFSLLLSCDSCNGHGECGEYLCNCHEFYFGDSCNNFTCDDMWKNERSVCNGNGQCISHNQCLCDEGFDPPQCLPSSKSIVDVCDLHEKISGCILPFTQWEIHSGELVCENVCEIQHNERHDCPSSEYRYLIFSNTNPTNPQQKKAGTPFVRSKSKYRVSFAVKYGGTYCDGIDTDYETLAVWLESSTGEWTKLEEKKSKTTSRDDLHFATVKVRAELAKIAHRLWFTQRTFSWRNNASDVMILDLQEFVVKVDFIPVIGWVIMIVVLTFVAIIYCAGGILFYRWCVKLAQTTDPSDEYLYLRFFKTLLKEDVYREKIGPVAEFEEAE